MWGEGLAEVFESRMGQRVLTGIGRGRGVFYPPPDIWAPAHESLQSRGAVDGVRLGRPLHLPPTPPAAAASPLNARQPEPKPRLVLRLPQHPGPPQSPHVTSDCPITATPVYIKGAGRLGPRLLAVLEAPRAPARVGLGAWRRGAHLSRGAWVGGPRYSV